MHPVELRRRWRRLGRWSRLIFGLGVCFRPGSELSFGNGLVVRGVGVRLGLGVWSGYEMGVTAIATALMVPRPLSA